MGSKGGQSATTQSQDYSSKNSSGSSSGVSSQTPDPLAGLAYQQVLRNASQIANTPFEPYQGQQVAGFTPDIQAGFQGVRNMQGVQNPYLSQAANLYEGSTNQWQNPMLPQTMDYYNQSFGYIPNAYMPQVTGYTAGALASTDNPMMDQAQNYFNQSFQSALNPLLQTSQGYYGDTFNLSDIGRFGQNTLNQYMNPYQQSVVDATLGQMKQNQDEMFNKNTANAIRQGSFGGSGQFMGQAEIARQQGLSNAQALAQLNSSNYQQAVQQYNQQQGQAIAAKQAAAQVLGQLGQQQAGLLSGAQQQAAQTMGQLGQQQSALKGQLGMQAAQLYGDLGNALSQRGIGAYQNAARDLGQLGQSQQELGMRALQGAASGVAGLGEQAQKSNLADAQALMQTGEVQRQLQQEQLNRAYQQWQQAKAYPYQQTSYFANLAQGVGPLMGQYGTTAANQQGTESGFNIGNKQTQTSGGGGGVLGALTSGLGLLSSLNTGGVVKDRTSRATGGYMENVGELPYGEGPVDLKAGFGSLMQTTPFSDAPENYIGEAEKTSKVMKPAKEVGAEKLKSAMDKALGLATKKSTLSFGDSGGDADGGESGSSGSGISKLIKSAQGLSEKAGLGSDFGLSSAFDSGTADSSSSSGGFDFGGIGDAISGLLKDGGRVEKADGGSYQAQYLKAKKAQDQAQQILADYRNLLGRNAEQGGFDYWAARAREGQTPEQRAGFFSNSPERARNVREAYVDILGRPPEKGGYDFWLDKAKKGMSFGDLQKSIKAAPESMFHNILNREPTPEEMAYWNKQTQSGMDPTSIMMAFQSSPEARANAAAEANPTLASKTKKGWAALDPSAGLAKAFAREKMIDPLDKPKSNYEMLLMQSRGMHPGPQLTPEQQGMPSMPGPRYYTGEEAYGQIGTPTSSVPEADAADAAKIEDLYRSAFGRVSDQPGMDYWLGRLKSGLSLGDIQKHFRNAQEYTETPEMFRSNAPVQGYFTSIANTQFNPDTGLFNLQYNAPYRGSAPQYDLSSGIAASDKLRGIVTDKLTSQLPKTSASGGRIGKADGGPTNGFYNSMYNAVLEAAKKRGAPHPEVLARLGAAQAMLETGGGKHAPNNNYFGIKGPGGSFSTTEVVNGRPVQTRASFRGYGSMEDSANDFVRLMASSPRYKSVFNASSPEQAIEAQARSGYATDPKYGVKLAGIDARSFNGAPPAGEKGVYAQNTAAPSGPGLLRINPASPRRSLLSRIIHELAPVGTAQAAEGQPADLSKPMFAWPKLRNFHTNDLPTALGMNKSNYNSPIVGTPKLDLNTAGIEKEGGGYPRLYYPRPIEDLSLQQKARNQENARLQLLFDSADESAPPRSYHENMGPEMEVPTPPKRSDAFPVVAEDREQGKKYYGDWRDQDPWKSDPIGGFFDALSGEEKKADKPGKYEQNSGFGDLFNFAKGGVVRRHYALGGGEEDLGNPLEELGSMIEQGFGGLFGGGDEAPTREAPEAGGGLGDLLGGGDEDATPKGVVAQDRPTPDAGPSMPQRGFLPPAVSQALIAAGMGMMASPRSNPFEAFGEGGLKGFQVYQTARAQEDKEAKEAAQQRAAAEYEQRLSGAPMAEDREETEATPTGRGSVSSGSSVDALMGQMERLSSIPAVTPQQIQQKNAKLRELQTRITIAEKIDERRLGKTGTIGRDEFGNAITGYTSGPNAGKSLAEVRREQGQPSGAQEPGAVDWSKTGEEFLSTLPVEDQNEVKGIAEGRLDLPKGPRAQGLWKAVTRYSPGFDTTVYGARKKMRDSYADQSGTKPGAQITAGNTAIGHAGELSDLILKLNNYDIDILNKPLNWVAEHYGGEAAQNLNKYRSLVDKYVDEQQSFYKGRGGGGIEERKEARERLDPNKGTKVLLDTLRGDQEAMGSKVSELEEAWNRTMGKGQSVPIEGYDVISKHGKEGKALLEHNFKVASGEAKPVRTGRTKDGRKVTEYSDGYRKYGE